MVDKYRIDKLIKSVPYSIRLEILRKQLTELYEIELNIVENYFRLGHKFTIFLMTIEKAELPNDMLISLYQWAKNERKKLGLKDTLFNIHESLIEEATSYRNLNEEINQRKIL